MVEYSCMSPEDRDIIDRMLTGRLDREGTIAAMDRVRGSEEARAYLERRSAEMRGGSAVATDRPIPPGSAAGGSPSFLRTETETARVAPTARILGRPGSRGGGLKRTALIGFIVVLLFGFAQKMKGGPEAPLVSMDLLVAEALEAGLPWIESPRGERGGRPKVVSLVMPPGNRRVSLRFVDSTGVRFEHTWTREEAPDAFVEVKRNGPDGKIAATEALLSFPSHEELALLPGRQIHIFAVLDNGNESPPSTFRVR
jgi:hypothetical protein